MSSETNEQGIDALEAAIASKKAATSQHYAEIAQYALEVKAALNLLVEKASLEQEATAQLLASTHQELETYKTSITGDSIELGSLREQVAHLEDDRARFESKIESYKQKLEQSKKQLRDQAGVSEDNEAHRARVVELENRLLEATEAKDAVNRRVGNLEDELAETRNTAKEAESLRKELEAFRECRNQEREEEEALRETLNANSSVLEAVSRELEVSQLETEKLKAESKQLMQTVTMRSEDLKRAEDRLKSETERRQAQLTDERASAQETITSLETTIVELQERMSQEYAQRIELESAIVDAQATIDELKNNVHSTSDEEAKHIGEIKELHSKTALLQQTVDSNVATITSLKDELTAANKKVDHADERLEELRGRAKKTAESEQIKSAALDKAKRELEDAEEDKEMRARLFEQCRDLESQVDQLLSRNASIEDELLSERAKGTKSALAKQLAEVLEDHEALQVTNTNLHKEVDELKARIAADAAMRRAVPRVEVEFNEIEAKQRLGDLLLKTGVITSEQLAEVIKEMDEEGEHPKIGQAFVDKGYATEDVIVQALAHQMEIPFLRIEHNTIRHDALRLISERMAEKHVCIPIRLDNGNLILAMENPMNLIAIEDIERISEHPVRPMISTSTDIHEAIVRHYQGKQRAR